jgi:predicted phosphohydrolase
MQAWNEVDANIVSKSFKAASISNSLDGSENYLCNKFITDSTAINEYVGELIKTYVDNDEIDEPYEDLQELKEEVRNNDAITYDLPQDVIELIVMYFNPPILKFSVIN